MKRIIPALALCMMLAGPAIAKPYPNISGKELTEAIRQNLQYHAPQYIVLLDQAYPDAGVRDLVRAGLLETASVTTSCSGPQWALSITEKGQSVAWARGWPAYHDVLTIQVGSLRYIAKSAKLFYSAGRPYAVRFEFRYAPGSNAGVLRGLGAARDWTTGDGFTLADSGRVFAKTLPLYYSSARGWYLQEEWTRRRTGIC